MKNNKKYLIILFAMFIHLIFTSGLYAYGLLLPDDPPDPLLPYIIEEDHYAGASAVQMILNSQPNLFFRGYYPQDDIYSTILMHNNEPTIWFSDPVGIRDTLEDAVYAPAPGVNWVDSSNVDKDVVLSKMVYYMHTRRYLTPVSIGDSEHWITVIGYQTADVPTSPTGEVDLINMLFYDPLPGNESIGSANYHAWMNTATYWGVPYNNPASSWHNKYIAVIEPPKARIKLKFKKWIIEGKIKPIKEIEEYYYRWYKEMANTEMMYKLFKRLNKNPEINEPVLIKASKYSYYFIPFKDQHLAAVVNAYTGEVEEFREYMKPKNYFLDRDSSVKALEKTLVENKLKLLKVRDMELIYEPKLTKIGRLSPVWRYHALVTDECNCNTYDLYIIMNCEGQIVKGLEGLKEYRESKEQ